MWCSLVSFAWMEGCVEVGRLWREGLEGVVFSWLVLELRKSDEGVVSVSSSLICLCWVCWSLSGPL